MLDRSAAIPAVLAKLDKLPAGHALDLRTSKRNRSVIILKRDAATFVCLENGFERHRLVISRSKQMKTLQKLLKKEFPRSRKVRLYDLGAWDERTDALPRRKTL